MAFPAFAGGPESYDILGAKLGMTSKQAMAAVQQHLPGLKLQVETGTTQYVPGKRFATDAAGSTARGSVLLLFAEDYPYNQAHPESLYSVRYQVSYKTEAENRAIHDTAVAKFGPPVADEATGALWCGHPVDMGGHTMRCTTPEPIVELHGPVLQLADGSLQKRMHDAWEKAQKVTAPPM